MNSREERIKELTSTIQHLTEGQIVWVKDVIEQLRKPSEFRLLQSSLMNQDILQDFGDALRIHHAFSIEPFTKDKFEYAMVKVMKLHGHKAKKAENTNPGHDITIDDVPYSLKTEAAKAIKTDKIHISKFMELGKGEWGTKIDDLKGLREQFLNHLRSYEKIFTLRTLEKHPNWHYELVEIPKQLLLEVSNGEFVMSQKSKAEIAKPGSCRVFDNQGELKFQLYFDGSGERKLRVEKLDKKYCKIHAEWMFIS